MRSTHEGPEADAQFECDELKARIFDIADTDERRELAVTLVSNRHMPHVPLDTIDIRVFGSDVVQPIVTRTGAATIRCHLTRMHARNSLFAAVDFVFPLGSPPSDAEIVAALERLRVECGAPEQNRP